MGMAQDSIIAYGPGEYAQPCIKNGLGSGGKWGQGGTLTNATALMARGGTGIQGRFNPIGTTTPMKGCISNLHNFAFRDTANNVWFGGEADNNPYILGNSIYLANVDSSGNTVTGGFSMLATAWNLLDNPSSVYWGVRTLDSSLWVCGDTQHGLRGIHGAAGQLGSKWVSVPLGGEKVRSIMASLNLIILTWSGKVLTVGYSATPQADLGWGTPTFAQSASSYSSNYDQPNQVQTSSSTFLTGVRMIAGGEDLNWAIDSSNVMWTWTAYGYRVGHVTSLTADQLNYATNMNSKLIGTGKLPAIPDTIVTDMACTHALVAGSIYGWGNTEQGTVGNGQQIDYTATSPPYFNGGGNEDAGFGNLVVFVPVRICPGKSNFITLNNGIYYNYYDEALDANGNWVGWGRNKGSALSVRTVAIDTAATLIEADYPCSWQRAFPTRLFTPVSTAFIWRSTSPGCFNACTPGPTTGSPCSTVTPTCYTNHAHLTLTASGMNIYCDATTSTTTGFLAYVTFSATGPGTVSNPIPDNPVTQTDSMTVSATGTYTVKVVIQDPNWGADSTTLTVNVTGGVTNHHWYVDSTGGNDGNSCASTGLACQTFGKAVSLASSGDTISIKAGERYPRTMYPISGILINSYGTGNAPLVSGSYTIPAAAWVSIGNGIYEALVPNDRATLNCVTLDGMLAGMGRYPDTGWVTYTGLTSTTLTSAAISIFPFTFSNGTVAIRDEFYIIDTVHNNATGTNTLTLATAPTTTTGRGNGFFMMNHPNTLRTTLRVGSWWNNVPVDSLQMFFGVAGPTGHIVKVAVLDTGFYASSISNVTVQGINFEYFNQFHVFENNTTNIFFDSCKFQHAGNNIVTANNAAHSTFRYDTMRYANNNWVAATGSSSLYPTFQFCYMDSAGMTAGMGKSGSSTTYTGISWGFGFGTYQFNTLLNTGYHTVFFTGDSNNVHHNLTMFYCMVKADGASWYTWDGSFIAYLYFSNIDSNIAIFGGSPGSGIVFDASDMSFSFYADGHVQKRNFFGNIGAYNPSAGGINHGSNNIWYKNNWFGNNYSQFMMAEAAGISMTNITYKMNVHGFQPAAPFSLTFTTPLNDLSSFCTACDSNYFLTPIGISNSLLTKSSVDAGTNRTLASWQTNLGIDLHSHLNQSAPLQLVYSTTTGSQSVYGYNIDPFGVRRDGSISLVAFTGTILQRLSLPPVGAIKGGTIRFH